MGKEDFLDDLDWEPDTEEAAFLSSFGISSPEDLENLDDSVDIKELDDIDVDFEKGLDALSGTNSADEPTEAKPQPKEPEPELQKAAQVSKEPEPQPKQPEPEPEPQPEVKEQPISAQEVDETVDDLMDILSAVPQDEDLSEIEDLLEKDENGEVIIPGADGELEMDPTTKDNMEQFLDGREFEPVPEEFLKTSGKKAADPNAQKGEKKKESFLAKLARIFLTEFGEEKPQEDDGMVVIKEDDNDFSDLSDENLQILRELEGAGAGAAPKELSAKEKKKQEKEAKKAEKKKAKEEKKKAKAEQKKAKAASKPKKEKKPKAPKEKSKPLPKKPLILIAVMAVSLFLLIYLGTQITSYSGYLDEAVAAYEEDDYISAYETIAGLDVKDKDYDTKYRINMLASLQNGVNSSDLAYARKQYDESLNALIIAVGRYDEYYDEAQTLEISEKCDKILSEVEERLSSEFKMSVEEARSIYSIRKRKDYSIEIEKVVSGLGL